MFQEHAAAFFKGIFIYSYIEFFDCSLFTFF